MTPRAFIDEMLVVTENNHGLHGLIRLTGAVCPFLDMPSVA